VNRRRTRVMLLAAGAIVALLVGGLALASARSRPPGGLGVTGGRLAPCPDSPNCVSTRSERESQRMEPIAFTGDPVQALARLSAALEGMPRTTIVERGRDYLRAECTSALFRFVDDVEVLIDRQAQVVHFRSASRTGRSDLGVNRRRMERLRAAFESAR
jgi:uncharacterized protein (DUF1499 family)